MNVAPLRLMLVDDHPIVRRGVRDILLGAFPTAVIGEVSSGGSALMLLGDDRWDLVVLDLTLPDESGIDVLKELRADPAMKDLPIVIYSAVSEHRYVKQAMDHGATDYWLKGSLHGPDLETRLAAYLPDATGWAEPPASHPMA